MTDKKKPPVVRKEYTIEHRFGAVTYLVTDEELKELKKAFRLERRMLSLLQEIAEHPGARIEDILLPEDFTWIKSLYI